MLIIRFFRESLEEFPFIPQGIRKTEYRLHQISVRADDCRSRFSRERSMQQLDVTNISHLIIAQVKGLLFIQQFALMVQVPCTQKRQEQLISPLAEGIGNQ